MERCKSQDNDDNLNKIRLFQERRIFLKEQKINS